MQKIQNTNQSNKPKNTFDPEKAKRLFAYKSGRSNLTWGQRQLAREYIDRAVVPNIDGGCRKECFRMIFDRTIAYDKEWERITERHFSDGVFRKEPPHERIRCGTGYTVRNVRRALDSLVQDGLIRRGVNHKGKGEYDYALAPLDEIHLLQCFAGKDLFYRGRLYGEAGKTRTANGEPYDEVVLAPRTKCPVTPDKMSGLNHSNRTNTKTSLRSERKAPACNEVIEQEEKAAPAAQPPVRQRRRPQREAHQSRYPRVSREVEDDFMNREVQARGRELADAQAEGATERPAGAFPASGGTSARPDPGTPASGPQNGAGAPATRQRTRVPTGVPELERDWAAGVKEATGCAAIGWTAHERAQVADMVRRVPMPDPGMNWKTILHRIATRWGEMNGLARPAAFRHGDNVDRIIKAAPRIYHVIRHAEAFVQTYERLLHGGGMSYQATRQAQKLQDDYEWFCDRQRQQLEVGSDRLPSALRSGAELEDLTAIAAMDGDARAEASRKRQAFLRREYQELRKQKGAEVARIQLERKEHARARREAKWDMDLMNQYARPSTFDDEYWDN